MSLFTKGLAAASSGHRSKWIVLAVWLLIAIGLSPLAGRLNSVEDTGANALLPRSAQSTLVNSELEQFRSADLLPAVVVYTAVDGLDAADRSKASTDLASLRRLAAPGRVASSPVAAVDRHALITAVPLPNDKNITHNVDRIRAITEAHAPPGLTVRVGGPAGTLTDQVAVFSSFNSALMGITALVIVLLLLLIYRSPALWLLPLVSVGFATVLTQVGTYLLAAYAHLPVNPQSAGILTVLVFGVGTDYALLLIARYREELAHEDERHAAMRTALRRCLPAVFASAGTITLGLACLAFADSNSTRSIGLVGAVGVIAAALVMTTALPALLVIAGRGAFWPRIPRPSRSRRNPRTVWERIGRALQSHPILAGGICLIITGVLALGVLGMRMGLSDEQMFWSKPDSVVAQQNISAHYPAGASDPAVVVANSDHIDAVATEVRRTPGVASAAPGVQSRNGALTMVPVTLIDPPDSKTAKATIAELRDRLGGIAGADAKVGGSTAQALDTQTTAGSDLRTVIPMVLIVVLLVLVLLLRALVGPLVLLGTVVLSYLAALGSTHLIFQFVLGCPRIDWSIPLLGFVFLVALGIDYNIFLMTSVKEEAAELGHVRGVLAALSRTGGVITSAGVVLAATFAVFIGLPLVTMAQLGVIVGVGILLDTFLIRTFLVPALALGIGPAFWWPRHLLPLTSMRGPDLHQDDHALVE